MGVQGRPRLSGIGRGASVSLTAGRRKQLSGMDAAQIDNPVDANSAAACTVVGQDTDASLSTEATVRAVDEHEVSWRITDLLRSVRLG